ncbi:MAG: hypothetical protein ACYCWE_09625 [Eubacteriales bacterium]
MKIQRKQKVVEKLELCDENGEVKITIDVVIDVDRMMSEINKAQNQVIRAQMDVNKVKNEINIQNYGVAILELIRVIFGEKDAEQILRHYDGSYSEMLEDIMPFISESIMPKIQKVAAERLARMKKIHMKR